MNLKFNFFISLLLIVIPIFAYTQQLNVGKDKIVKVNNRVITLRELEKEFKQRSKLPSLDGTPVTKKSVLQSMIDEELLRNDIKNKSIVVDENQLKTMLDQYKMLYTQEMTKDNPNFKFSEEEYRAYIQKEVELTYDKFEEKVKETIMVRQYIEKRCEKKLQDVFNRVYADSKLEEFYDANIKEFVAPRSVEIKHIFLKGVDYKGDPLPQSEKTIVKKRADDILKRLKAGENFDALCEMHSEDIESRDKVNPKTNKLDRGYLGSLYRNDDMARTIFGDDIINTLFNIQKGRFSEVLESKSGFHIFLVTDKQEQRIIPFAEAKPQIINYFKMADREKILRDEFTSLLKDLKSKANIEYYMNEYK